jgi:hypothetical protein
MAMASILAGIFTGVFAAVVLILLGQGLVLAFFGYVLGGLMGTFGMIVTALLRSAGRRTQDQSSIDEAATA